MWRVSACALLVFGLGCQGSKEQRGPDGQGVLESSAFILESTSAFFAKRDEPLAPGDSPKPAR
jgi:hypothetical protein